MKDKKLRKLLGVEEDVYRKIFCKYGGFIESSGRNIADIKVSLEELRLNKYAKLDQKVEELSAIVKALTNHLGLDVTCRDVDKQTTGHLVEISDKE